MTAPTLTPPAGGARITLDHGRLTVPTNPIIPFIEGDGTGADIWRASVRVLDAAVARAYGGQRLRQRGGVGEGQRPAPSQPLRQARPAPLAEQAQQAVRRRIGSDHVQHAAVAGQASAQRACHAFQRGAAEKADVLAAVRCVVGPGVQRRRGLRQQLGGQHQHRRQRGQLAEGGQRIFEMFDHLEAGHHVVALALDRLEAAREQVVAVAVAPAEIVAAVAQQTHEQAAAAAVVETAAGLRIAQRQQAGDGVGQPQVAVGDAAVERGDRAVGVGLGQPVRALGEDVAAGAATTVLRGMATQRQRAAEYRRRRGAQRAGHAGRAHALSPRARRAGSSGRRSASPGAA